MYEVRNYFTIELMDLQSLPTEVIIYMMTRMHIRCLVRLKSTSKRLCSIYYKNSQYIYKKKLENEFPALKNYRTLYNFAALEYDYCSVY